MRLLINEKTNCVRHEMTYEWKNKLCKTTCVRNEIIYDAKINCVSKWDDLCIKNKLCKTRDDLWMQKKIV